MIRRANIVVLFIAVFFQVNGQNPSFEIEFTTADMGGFSHEKHVLAVWVETATEDFVKSQLVYADVRKVDLFTWNDAPAYGNEMDAITAATQLLHKTYTISWDCSDTNGNIIPNGNYVLHIEMNNNHSQGPLAEISFTIGQNSFTLNPPDEDYFKNISLEYTPNTVSTNEINKRKNDIVNIYPNPVSDVVVIELNLDSDEYVTIAIFDEESRLIKTIADNKHFLSGRNSVEWVIDKKTGNGIYFVSISTKTHLWFGKKIILKR